MGFYEMFGDREADSCAASCPGSRSIDAVETLKEVGQMLSCDSNALISDADDDLFVLALRPDRDAFATRGVL